MEIMASLTFMKFLDTQLCWRESWWRESWWCHDVWMPLGYEQTQLCVQAQISRCHKISRWWSHDLCVHMRIQTCTSLRISADFLVSEKGALVESLATTRTACLDPAAPEQTCRSVLILKHLTGTIGKSICRSIKYDDHTVGCRQEHAVSTRHGEPECKRNDRGEQLHNDEASMLLLSDALVTDMHCTQKELKSDFGSHQDRHTPPILNALTVRF